MKHAKPKTLTLAAGLLGVTVCAGQSNDSASPPSTSTSSASEESVSLTAPAGDCIGRLLDRLRHICAYWLQDEIFA